MKRCKKCNLPNNVPKTHLNSEGICNLCVDYKEENRNYQGIEQLRIDVRNILNKHCDLKYDCMLGFSGGRDSTYLLYLLKKILKLNVLAVTVIHDFMPECTLNNIKNTTAKLNVEHIMINNENLNKYSRKCVKAWSKKPTAEMILTFCTGCRCVNSITLPQYAKNNHIPILFLGNAPYEILTYRTDLLSINSDNPSSINKVIGYLAQLIKNPAYLKYPNAIRLQGKEFLNFENYNDKNAVIIKPFYNYIEWKEEDVNAVLKETDWQKEELFTSSHRSDCYVSYLRQYYYKEILGFNDLDIHLSLNLRNGEISNEEYNNCLQRENKFSEEKISKIMENYFGCDFQILKKILKR
ncbi:hypothetical protein [Anaerocolumna jejuensis]|uniref:hypothetical protein n=1 Tax=Anaerocolumna jejuensis TaxID=259063 RepID=UPI003F7CA626